MLIIKVPPSLNTVPLGKIGLVELRDILHASEGPFTSLVKKGTFYAILGVLNYHRQTDRHTHRQTDGHGDSMTESAELGQIIKNVSNELVRTGN